MTEILYLTDWFIPKIAQHSAVKSSKRLSANRLGVLRRDGVALTIAPVQVEILSADLVEQILQDDIPTIICLVPKASHYLWSARERATELGSDVQTMSEVFWSMTEEDPQGFLSNDVTVTRRILRQHSQAHQVEMICESSMRIARAGGMSDVTVSVEYGYEFGEEALVKALDRHPGMDVVLNSNPNGRMTAAALEHAKHAGVRLLNLSSLMGALKNP
ncbi:hypothetical protein [Streptomyces acidiscabies]|uniref:Uncharacterized protein n=1 Tax=Streptomyces acidiscabies TaxID=42234 RepID=A0AAP6ELX3_9ACTN|nr:hypothetical protein [Streptomyces acidiscabies]MBP5938535.1 hypothetical protein [Streptomyces sp. LBUM 1476]MBZ3909649.1 hypothetical protein [Streptomyces acidiscabies]MDX2967383.1 hypothetical protein [Streptomyces acidiscabies]MDX3019632.1 hypothetical protein [Streptomyces acidiscabies]MDX3792200.1 hypothetical protein [Streptomyces acidiscabies]